MKEEVRFGKIIGILKKFGFEVKERTSDLREKKEPEKEIYQNRTIKNQNKGD